MAQCRSCGAEIVWVRMVKSGKANPLDAKPEMRVVITTKIGEDQYAEVVATYVSHFATCPNAKQHRKEESNG